MKSEQGPLVRPARESGLERSSDRAPRTSGIKPTNTSDFVSRADPVSSRPAPVLDAATISTIRSRFAELAGDNNQIDVGELTRSLRLEDPFLAHRVLDVLDADGGGHVSRLEFEKGLPRLLFGCIADKLKFAFRLHDCNSDGLLDREELSVMVRVGLTEEGMSPSTGLVERFVGVVMTAADRNGDGKISRAEFEVLALGHPKVIEMMAEAELNWFGPDRDSTDTLRERMRLWANLLLDNRASIVFLGVWFLATVFVMALGAYKHRAGGAYLMTARAAGAALNLNIGLLVLATARVVMGRIRRTPILRTLPVDHAIAFHQLVAYAVVVFAIVHTAAHLVRRRAQGVAIMDWLTADFFAMSGVVLAALLLLIFVTALPKVRTSGGFEWFRRTHLLYPVWLLLALSHGRHLWAWTLVPLGLFTLDRAARFVVKSRETEVVDLEPLVSGVTKVTLKKPDGFTHTAGDYLYLKIPRIAASEWHPFTISSAPENPVLTLHVRSLGDYTKRLHQLALERMASRSGESLGASIEGPFGTPSADILGSDIAVMVAGGIGVTPFASVLESIIMGSRQKKPQKVYFYWLNREGAAFAWFFGLLSQLEHRDTTRLVDIRVFMTRGQGRSTSMVLNLARSIRHGVGDRDHVTGLRTQTRMGAPNFRAELLEIVEHHPGRQVDVFFCGPPGLANSLKRDCASLGLPFRQEHF